MKVGLAVLLDINGADAIVQGQSELRKLAPIQPVLSTGGNLPHITLLQATVPDTWSGTKICDELVAGCIRPPSLQFIAVTLQRPDWIFLNAERTDALEALHNAARESMESWLKPAPPGVRFAEYSEAEKQSYLSYGYRYIGPAFLPHVTLGRGGENASMLVSAGRNLLETGSLPRSAKAYAISAYELGSEGAHARTLAQALVQ